MRTSKTGPRFSRHCFSRIKVTTGTAMPQVINRLPARGSNNFHRKPRFPVQPTTDLPVFSPLWLLLFLRDFPSTFGDENIMRTLIYWLRYFIFLEASVWENPFYVIFQSFPYGLHRVQKVSCVRDTSLILEIFNLTPHTYMQRVDTKTIHGD